MTKEGSTCSALGFLTIYSVYHWLDLAVRSVRSVLVDNQKFRE